MSNILPPPDDLIVEIQETLGFAEYHGRRALLEAEGVIPAGTEWPQGYDEVRWQAGPVSCELYRQRPAGGKGSRKQYAACDWWLLRFKPTQQLSPAEMTIARAQKELNDTIYRNSPQGVAESNAQWLRYFASAKDTAFQTFKAACGIVEKRRGRPSKQQTQGAAA